MCIMVLICGAHFNQHHLNKVGSWLTPVLTEPKFVFYELMVPVSLCHLDFFFFSKFWIFWYIFYKIYKNNK